MEPESPPPIVPPARKDGSEPIHGDGEPIPSTTLRDFWSWAYSDLLSNALRGVLAEYIVGLALGCIGPRDTRLEWDAYDLKTTDGLRVEVKSTAHLQSWGTTKLRSRSFDIRPTTAWNARTNTYDSECKRQADVYVFCVHTTDDRGAADPLDVEQWMFYVVGAGHLNALFPEQKSVALSVVRRHADPCDYRSLRTTVEASRPEQAPGVARESR